MKTLTTEQIIEKFKSASIYINKVVTTGWENNMICIVYRDTPRYFPTYYSAYDFFNRKGIIN